MSPAPGVGPVRRADALGLASIALGAPMLLSPRRTLEFSGIRADRRAKTILIGVGVREFVAAVTILGMRHRRVGCWSRVMGDTMDLGLLGSALFTRRERTVRLLGTIAFIASVFGSDLITALELNKAEGVGVPDGSESQGEGAPPEEDHGPTHVRTAVTILGSEEDVCSAARAFEWSAFDLNALEASGRARFVAAPGDRGVEFHIDYEPPVRGGRLVGQALKLGGMSPDQTINDELRRFKALFETGVEPRSDKTPAGFSARGQIFQRPGQPSGGTEHSAESTEAVV